jgi:hypothetical protein
MSDVKNESEMFPVSEIYMAGPPYFSDLGLIVSLVHGMNFTTLVDCGVGTFSFTVGCV